MRSVRLHTKRDGGNLRNHATLATVPNEMTDVLLALDRVLVEVSMDLYNLKGHDRRKMRAHNGRLHAALREHLSQPRKQSRG